VTYPADVSHCGVAPVPTAPSTRAHCWELFVDIKIQIHTVAMSEGHHLAGCAIKVVVTIFLEYCQMLRRTATHPDLYATTPSDQVKLTFLPANLKNLLGPKPI